MLLSVVVLARGRVPETRRCLAALRRNTPGPLEVVLVDNASGPGDRRALAAAAKEWPAVRLLRNRSNRPFAAAVNAALRLTRGGTVCLLNNDAVVARGWRAGLEGALLADPAAAAAGPMTDAMAPPAQLGGARRLPPRETPVLGGFCLLLRRADLEARGGFDERYVWGWEDMDLSLRLRRAGRRLLLVPGVFVRHTGSLTISALPSSYRVRTDRANRALFRSRWLRPGPLGRDARAILAASPAPWDEAAAEVSLLLRNGQRPLPPRRTRGVRLESLAPGEAPAGRWLLLLDRGALPAPGALSRLRDALAGRPDAVAAGPLSKRTWLGWQRADHGDASAPARPVPFLRGGCLLVDRAAFARAGGLDGSLEPADAEADLCLRLRRDGGTLLLVPSALAEGPRPPRWQAPTAAGERSTRTMFARWGTDPLAAA